MYVRRWHPKVCNGKTALLIHGLASSSLTWLDLAKDLADLGYEVVAPDLSGHGKSPRKDSYSVKDWTSEIVELGIKPNLIVGHSIGGLVAANLYDFYPDSKIALLDPVFRLPRGILMNIVRTWFTMFNRRPFSKDYRMHLLDRSNARRWDTKSVMALAQPFEISKRFISEVSDALLIRAKRSYILPRLKDLPSGVLFETYNVGHNIHREAHMQLHNSLEQYLTREFTKTSPITI